MGYFPNGTSGMMYEDEYCDKCVHMLLEFGCPCMDAHTLWNYDECNNGNSILHKMIPRNKNGFNERCIFFRSDTSQEAEIKIDDSVYVAKKWGK